MLWLSDLYKYYCIIYKLSFNAKKKIGSEKKPKKIITAWCLRSWSATLCFRDKDSTISLLPKSLLNVSLLTIFFRCPAWSKNQRRFLASCATHWESNEKFRFFFVGNLSKITGLDSIYLFEHGSKVHLEASFTSRHTCRSTLDHQY